MNFSSSLSLSEDVNDTRTAVIYKITCKTSGECYIGSTVDLKRRITQHKKAINDETNKNYNQYLYNYARENGGFANFKIEILEYINIKSCAERNMCEQKWKDVLTPLLNTVEAKAKKTSAERYKEYADKNPEIIKETKQKSYLKLKEENKKTEFRCEKCNLCFSFKSSMTYHIKNKICEKVKEVKSLVCASCNKEYGSISALNKHIKKLRENGSCVKIRSFVGTIQKFKQPPEGNLLYSVRIGDTVVYKHNDITKIRKFKETEKYKYAVETGNFKII